MKIGIGIGGAAAISLAGSRIVTGRAERPMLRMPNRTLREHEAGNKNYEEQSMHVPIGPASDLVAKKHRIETAYYYKWKCRGSTANSHRVRTH